MERSKQWAVRLMHEAQLHEANSFITLTYDTNKLPQPRDGEDASRGRRPLSKNAQNNHAVTGSLAPTSLTLRHTQLFMKRLRHWVDERKPATKVKFYLVGEYGEKRGRPHYHAAIYGEDFSADRYAAGKSPSGEQLYRSPALEKLWPHGYSSVGDLTFQSAAYIARYVMKKINGPMADEHYKRENPLTGEIYWITPEFAVMSRGGRTGKGIGHGWWEKYRADVYPHDFVVMAGAKHKPPRYYDKLLELVDKEGAALMKLDREFSARSAEADNTPRRLRAKEKVAIAKGKLNKRSLE